MKGPQLPKEQTNVNVEVGVEGQGKVRSEVKVKTKGEMESVRIKEKRDNQLTKGCQLGRLRHTPGCCYT